MPNTLINIATVADYFDVCPKTVRRWAELGVIPQPLRLGPRVIRWQEAEILKRVEEMKHPSPKEPSR